ncbi:MAG TPA: hypothetical protein VF032_05820 [Thermoleophilaceae bacterium]
MGRRVAVATALAALAASPAAHADTRSPAAQLATRYVPVLGFEPQKQPCGPGQVYRPTRVDTLLGHPEVKLRGPDGRVVGDAPTGPELFGLGEGYYIDQPGDPLRPGCTFEKNWLRWSAGTKPVVYAHLATDAAHRDKLALQYWFFYTFNDFSGKHEGDWEMAQLDFEATSPEEALRKEPYQVDAAQHAGGERTDWASRNLVKQGTHPVLFVSTGSQATYFGRELYLGRGPSEGFGCDDTRDTTTLVHPGFELLPEVPDSASQPFAWLAFHGRWGQREKGFNNGPTGPSAKEAWTQPIEWADGLRDSSVTVPGTRTFGPSVTHFFCGAVKQVSVVLNWALVHPFPFYIFAGLVLAGTGQAARRTTWRPVLREPLRMRRGGGQILRAALRIYLSDARTFLGIGAAFVPLSILAAAVQWVLFHLTGLGAFVALDGRHGAVTTLLALLIGGVGAAIASVCTTAAVACALDELDRGGRIGPVEAFRRASRHAGELANAFVRQFGSVVILSLLVIGIPFALYLYIRWSLFAQACVLEKRSGRGSLRRSAALVRGKWWRTFGFTALVNVLAALSGPLFGVALLLLTDRSLNFINVAGSVIYTATVPYAIIALTLYYFDLEARR